nr:MAG TPA: hypothetical protein [Crassvirales sp.]
MDKVIYTINATNTTNMIEERKEKYEELKDELMI